MRQVLFRRTSWALDAELFGLRQHGGRRVEVTGGEAEMEDSNLFRAFPGELGLAELFRPLSAEGPSLPLKDKLKVTIRSNAGVKCLRISPPALPVGSPEGLSSGDIGCTQTGSPASTRRGERLLPCKGGLCTSEYEESLLYEVCSKKNKGNEPPITTKWANMAQTERSHCKPVLVKEEPRSGGEYDVPDSKDGHTDIKEEQLSDGEDGQGDTEHPFSHGRSKKDGSPQYSLHIKKEPLSEEDLPDLNETQIITLKIKEEPLSSQEESDGQPALTYTQEDTPSHKMEFSPSRIVEKTRTVERILPLTTPLLIRTLELSERKIMVKKETKSRLLKRVLELGDAANDQKEGVRSVICTLEKMYKCSKCGCCFTSRVLLRRHNKAHGKYRVPCPDCGRLFTCGAAVRQHQVRHSQEKPFPCSFCQKHFSTSKGREVHERRHRGNKLFTCPECRKSFLFKAQLKAHQMQHMGECYMCLECGRCYRTNPGLTLHMKVHRGEMSYFCPECGKGFVQKSNLRNHLRVHSNVKGYSCTECGKAFRQRSNLKQHLSIHAAKERERYSCSECGRSYKRKADYRWHMLIHLGES